MVCPFHANRSIFLAGAVEKFGEPPRGLQEAGAWWGGAKLGIPQAGGTLSHLGAAHLAARGRCWSGPPQEWDGDLGLNTNYLNLPPSR